MDHVEFSFIKQVITYCWNFLNYHTNCKCLRFLTVFCCYTCVIIKINFIYTAPKWHEEGDCHVCANNTRKDPKFRPWQQSWYSSVIFLKLKNTRLTHGKVGKGQNQKQSNTGKQIQRGTGKKCPQSKMQTMLHQFAKVQSRKSANIIFL